MKNLLVLLLLGGFVLVSDPLFSDQPLTGDDLIVGYYGRPGAPRLGILGQHSIEELKPLIQAKADEYDQLNGDHKASVEATDQIKLLLNLDGHGSPALKVKIYNGLYSAKDPEKNIAGGFKLFFQEDKPEMMTPRQVLGMDPVGKSRIKVPPSYINYQ